MYATIKKARCSNMSNSKFFPGVVIDSAEAIATTVNAFKAFEFAPGERAEAIKEITRLIDDYNTDLRVKAAGEILMAPDFIAAMIPAITLDAPTASNSNKRKRAVINAVSYPQYTITEKNGTHEIRKRVKALTVRDLFADLVDLAATKHADNKPTKADRDGAKATLIPAYRADALRLFTYSAYRFENITESVQAFGVLNSHGITDGDKALFLTDKPSKANAEKQIKALSRLLDFDGGDAIAWKRVHGLALYKRAYTVDRFHQAKTADALDLLQDFITVARYAKNGIPLPEIIDRGDIFASQEAESEAEAWTF